MYKNFQTTPQDNTVITENIGKNCRVKRRVSPSPPRGCIVSARIFYGINLVRWTPKDEALNRRLKHIPRLSNYQSTKDPNLLFAFWYTVIFFVGCLASHSVHPTWFIRALVRPSTYAIINSTFLLSFHIRSEIEEYRRSRLLSHT